MKSKWNILVVDDQPIITFCLNKYLKMFSWCNCVFEATNGEEAIYIAKQNSIDLVIMDHNMPIMNGYETTIYLKKYQPKIRIIIYSSYIERNLIDEYFEAGVHAFLSKELFEIERVISKVMAGQLYIIQEFQNQPDYPKNNYGSKRPILFTTKEYTLVKLIAEGKKNDAISKEMKLSIQSISTYKKRLVKKFVVNNVTELVHYAHKIGAM